MICTDGRTEERADRQTNGLRMHIELENERTLMGKLKLKLSHKFRQ